VGHFWLLVWQQRSQAVLMLNRVYEKGQLKCHQYWPLEEGQHLHLPDVGLSLQHVGSVPGQHYTVRTLKYVSYHSVGVMQRFYRQGLVPSNAKNTQVDTK
jgi:tyrosine-protein phosphatase non-receptor type 1